MDFNEEQIKEIDKSNFRQFILDTPSQFKVGMDLAKDIKIDGNFNNLTVSGMGGSALPADLLRIFVNGLVSGKPSFKPFDIYVNRYYSLPHQAKQNSSLNFLASYSGNTEETIASFHEAQELGLPSVGFSSGGKLEELCREHGIPHIKLPVPFPNYQPRMGTGYFIGAMVQVLINLGMLPDVSADILNNAQKFNDLMSSYEERGKALALKIKGKTPVIYTPSPYMHVAMVWKIKINENAKTPAFWNFFPELNHNEMVGFTNPQAKFFVIMFKDADDNPQNLKRYEATAKLIGAKGNESEIIEMEGGDVFSKIFSTITLADWTSYYLALAYNQDPTPVDLVEELKGILAS